MNTVAILLWWFWRSLEWRQHERPTPWAEHAPTALCAPNGENRDEPAVASVDRHGALSFGIARYIFTSPFGATHLFHGENQSPNWFRGQKTSLRPVLGTVLKCAS